LKREKNWNDWLKVGEALQVGREWAMNQAGTNQAVGKAYNMAFGEWLAKYKLGDMDKGDRSRLFTVMDNLPMIEQWRQTLTQTERFKLNHPNAVWRKWKAAVEPDRPKDAKLTLRDSVANLSEENTQLKAQIEELEAARETSTASAPPASLEAALDHVVAELLQQDLKARTKVLLDLTARLGIEVTANKPVRKSTKAPAEAAAPAAREARMRQLGFRKTGRRK
jgi:hypothetical protein